MLTHIISIVKDKKGDLSDKDNYRPIAITCVTSKILELLIISKYGEFFDTRCNQFAEESLKRLGISHTGMYGLGPRNGL